MKSVLLYLIHAFFLYFIVSLPLENASIEEILFFLVSLLSILIYYLDRAAFFNHSFWAQVTLSIVGGTFYGVMYYFYSDKSWWESCAFFLLIVSMLGFLFYSIFSSRNKN